MRAKFKTMFSAEPCRRVPYSADLRWRIVWRRIGMEQSFRDIARSLNISVGTAFNIFKIFEETGNVDPKKREFSGNIVTDRIAIMILAIIFENPNLYLKEMTQKIFDYTSARISPATVCNVMHKHGLTRKKIQHFAVQRSARHRGAYIAEMSMYKSNMLVFADETGKDGRDCLRRFGYALKGQTPQCSQVFRRGTRLSAIAAISTSGLVGYELHTGSVRDEEFHDFVRGTLIPNMNPYDGEADNSILVMDNCSIHHVEEIVELLQRAGILVILPPYSPDFNPIELTFSYLKKYLQEHEQVIQAANYVKDVIVSAFENITQEYCTKWISHCGYQ